jgi:hypothetical protein
MKSFSQFLNESYLNEEPAGRPARRRTGGPTPEEVKAQIDAKEAEKAAKKVAKQPSGAAARPDLQFKRSTVASPTTTPSSGSTGTPPTGPVRPSIGNVSGPASSPTRPAGTPPTGPVRPSIGNVSGPASSPKPPKGPKGAKPPTSPTPTAKPTVGKPPIGVKPSGVLGKLGKLAGPLGVAADVGLETMDQKSRGRKTGSALAMGATKAAGGLAGAKAGALTGAKFGSVLGPKGAAVGAAVGGLGGYLAGSGIAGKASETIAGATGKEKAAMATANRQKQAGTAVKGIGGSTSFSQKKPGGPAFMSTGSGAQRKTVQLAKTGVVQRGGQSVAGNLAFKGGKAVYKAGPSAQSLAKTSSNPLERVGRSLFAGAYKAHDAKQAAKKLATARASDAARNLKLGVKAKPAG